MADAETPKPDPGTATFRDPRMVWTLLIMSFALMCFACTLIFVGDADRRSYVTLVFIMSIVMLVTSGLLKIGDASVLIKAVTGKG
jgi:hypothetical protein